MCETSNRVRVDFPCPSLKTSVLTPKPEKSARYDARILGRCQLRTVPDESFSRGAQMWYRSN